MRLEYFLARPPIICEVQNVSGQIDWLEQKSQWAGVRTIAMIEETREVGEQTSFERRFFYQQLASRRQQNCQSSARPLDG
jgi:hypothetical protein